MLFNLAVSRQPAPSPFSAPPAAARPAPFSAPLTAPLPPMVGRGNSQSPTGTLLDGCVVVGDNQQPTSDATPTEAEVRAQSAGLGVPQLTTLASWGGLARLLAALRTRDESPNHAGPNRRQRCGRGAWPKSPISRP